MCLAIPGKVIEIGEENGMLSGLVDFGGVRKRVCLEYVPDVKADDYVVVHVGFALSKVDEQEARRIVKFLESAGELSDLEAADEVR